MALQLGYFLNLRRGRGSFARSRFFLQLGAEAKLFHSRAAEPEPRSAMLWADGMCFRLYSMLIVDSTSARGRDEEEDFLRMYEAALDRLLASDVSLAAALHPEAVAGDQREAARMFPITRTNCFPNVMHVAYLRTRRRADILRKIQLLRERAMPGLALAEPEEALRWPQSAFFEWLPSAPASPPPPPPTPHAPPRPPRLRVGLLSSSFGGDSSIFGSFGPTLLRLPAELFELTIIYFPQRDGQLDQYPTPMRPLFRFGDVILDAVHEEPGGEGEQPPRDPKNDLRPVCDAAGSGCTNVPWYVPRMRRQILEKQLDVLLYLDLYMQPEMHFIACSKLATVQAVTHGHPVSSGIDASIVDFFVSWEGAERVEEWREEGLELLRPPADAADAAGKQTREAKPEPDSARPGPAVEAGGAFSLPRFTAAAHERAQRDYTEKLLLLPQELAWEFYEPRSDADTQTSLKKHYDPDPAKGSAGLPAQWGHYTRTTLLETIEALFLRVQQSLPDAPGGQRLASTPHASLASLFGRLGQGKGGGARPWSPADLAANYNWYLCAQVSFKLHSDFDAVIAGILRADPRALVILVDYTVKPAAWARSEFGDFFGGFVDRLAHSVLARGIEDATLTNTTKSKAKKKKTKKKAKQGRAFPRLPRTFWLPRLPHPLLMAFHNNADVVLDGMWFGGDTTVREAIESGVSVVATNSPWALGGRWAAAYYGVMFDGEAETCAAAAETEHDAAPNATCAAKPVGFDDLVARDLPSYVELALAQAMASADAKRSRRKYLRELAFRKLFREQRAVREWGKAIYRMAGWEGEAMERLMDEVPVVSKGWQWDAELEEGGSGKHRARKKKKKKDTND